MKLSVMLAVETTPCSPNPDGTAFYIWISLYLLFLSIFYLLTSQSLVLNLNFGYVPRKPDNTYPIPHPCLKPTRAILINNQVEEVCGFQAVIRTLVSKFITLSFLFGQFEGRIILVLITIYAVLSISATPLVPVQVSEQPVRCHSSERADRDLIMTSKALTAVASH